MKTVVVTGGSGFIGSHLVQALNKKGIQTVNVDKVQPHKNLVGVINQITDISDSNFHYRYEQPDILFHLAANPWSLVNDAVGWFHGSKDAFYNNTVGTYNALKEINPKHIVFASTANIYGDGRKHREDSKINITSQYGYSKLIAEEIIRRSKIPFTIFRFGTVVGSRGRCFPNLLVWNSVHPSEEPVQIFCNGNTYRDLVHVEDIVDALMMSQSFVEETDRPRNTYNVSMGTEISGLELAKLTSEIANDFGYILRYKPVSFSAPGYVQASTLDISRIRESQGWEPLRDIYCIITELFDYYKSKDAIKPPTWDELR